LVDCRYLSLSARPRTLPRARLARHALSIPKINIYTEFANSGIPKRAELPAFQSRLFLFTKATSLLNLSQRGRVPRALLTSTREEASLEPRKSTFNEWMGRRMTLTVPQQASGSLKTDDHKNQRRSERSVLSDQMIRFVLLHFVRLDVSAARDYTFERHKTEYPHAKADLDLYDGAGKLVFQGREFPSGIAGYWRPSRISLVRDGAPNEKAWGRPSTSQVLTVN